MVNAQHPAATRDAVRVLIVDDHDLFRAGRDIVVDGRLKHGTFVAVPGTLVTKCPSKYTAKS